jgi:all-trans-retinol dehydrogenase (NAD+)
MRGFLSVLKSDVKGKVVLITGAGSGIGQLVAIRFAKLGSTLVLWDINEQGLKATQEKISAFGVKSVLQVVDVTNADRVYKVSMKASRFDCRPQSSLIIPLFLRRL